MSSAQPHRRGIIGLPSSCWLYDSRTGFDLTGSHQERAGASGPASIASAASRVTLPTFSSSNPAPLPITLDPKSSALVIIDMQNFFLSPLLGRPTESAGQRAHRKLIDVAIPAARKAGIRIIWLNWGLTDDDIKTMPPALTRIFGFQAYDVPQDIEHKDSTSPKQAIIENGGKSERVYRCVGGDMGTAVDKSTGETVACGRLLFRDSWNASLTPSLDAIYREGLNASPPDVLIHKNRMSGLCGASTPCTEFLDKEGITTLLFAGVNTDNCVAGSLQDAFSRGYNCVLLKDGCGTSSPASCQEMVEFNCEKSWGFVVTCDGLAQGVEAMEQ